MMGDLIGSQHEVRNEACFCDNVHATTLKTPTLTSDGSTTADLPTDTLRETERKSKFVKLTTTHNTRCYKEAKKSFLIRMTD